jgi:hypothetical protein
MKRLPVTAIAATATINCGNSHNHFSTSSRSICGSADSVSDNLSLGEDEDAQLLAYDTILLESLSTWENSFT